MNESDALVFAAYNAMAANLEVIYANNVADLPPEKYCQTLSWALWNNDAKLLMSVLDGEDINPWDISFVEDGLGDGSPDMQSMIEFAARKSRGLAWPNWSSTTWTAAKGWPSTRPPAPRCANTKSDLQYS